MKPQRRYKKEKYKNKKIGGDIKKKNIKIRK
jgi:hypothetical protein